MNPMFRLFPILTVLAFSLSIVRAQTASELDVQADQLSYQGGDNTVTASGNVVIRKGAQSLKADVVTYNTVTEQAHARGNVVFTNADQIWRGEELHYNFITGKGSFPRLDMEVGPFKVHADSTERLSPIQTRMEDVTVTTCPDPEDPEFQIHAGRVDVYEEVIVSLQNAVFKLRGIPFFYLPRFTLDKEREPTQFDVVPGYGSRDGFMLLTGYNRYPSEGYRTKTHLDYRSERGPAVGQDFIWYNPRENRDHTRLRGYVSLDDAPYKSDEQEAQLRGEGIDIDEERYRLKFFHTSNPSPDDTLWVKASYLSDARVVQDFFEREFRDEPVPETRAVYSAVGDGWNADIELSRQLNEEDFEAVNRMPEATFNVPRRAVGDSNFLYESETRAGFLERNYTDFQTDDEGLEDYDSTRSHTEHLVFYPTRHFGWLNVIPRAGFAATYYSDTYGREERVTPTSTVTTNNVIVTTLQTNNVEVSRGGDMRLLPEFGLETSFKAFGIVHDGPTSIGNGLRHVVEPFADYTFIPEPDLTPSEIYQFDDIDELGEEHSLAFGIRNKWQTKKILPSGRNRVEDLVNIGVRTEYDLRSEADPSLGDLLVDTELQLVEWAWVRFDVRYDTDLGDIDSINSELRFEHPENGNSLRIDQRFRNDEDHTLQFTYDLNPYGRVGMEGYTRYELEDAGFEEQELLFTYETDCVGYGLGGKWIKGDDYADGTGTDDDYQLWLQVWLTAFPRTILGTGGR